MFAGGERTHDVSFYFLGKKGVKGETESWCQTSCEQALPTITRSDSLLHCLANAPDVSFLQRQSQIMSDEDKINSWVISVAFTDGLGDRSETVPWNPQF